MVTTRWVNYNRQRTELSSERNASDPSLLKADALWCENKRFSDSNPRPMDPKASCYPLHQSAPCVEHWRTTLLHSREVTVAFNRGRHGTRSSLTPRHRVVYLSYVAMSAVSAPSSKYLHNSSYLVLLVGVDSGHKLTMCVTHRDLHHQLAAAVVGSSVIFRLIHDIVLHELSCTTMRA